MRISDWSSDVCSSDLLPLRYATRVPGDGFGVPGGDWGRDPLCRYGPFRAQGGGPELVDAGLSVPDAQLYGSGRAAARHTRSGREIGRASCRERVCQYVSISVVAVSLKKK